MGMDVFGFISNSSEVVSGGEWGGLATYTHTHYRLD